MAPELHTLLASPLARSAAVSALYAAVLLIVRGFLLRALSRTDLSAESQRRWRVQIRNVALAVLLIGLAIIWASELRTLALSIERR